MRSAGNPRALVFLTMARVRSPHTTSREHRSRCSARADANSADLALRSARDANRITGDSGRSNAARAVSNARKVDCESLAANRFTRVQGPRASGTSMTLATPGSGAAVAKAQSASPRAIPSSRAASSATATFAGCSR